MDTMENGSLDVANEAVYEAPMLTEVGDFALFTRGGWDWGNDNSWATIWF